MNPPQRWLDDPGHAPDGAVNLLRTAPLTRGLPDAVYVRSAARVARLGVGLAKTGATAVWFKPLLSVVTLGLVVGLAVATLRPATRSHPRPTRAPHSATPTPPSPLPTPPPPGLADSLKPSVPTLAVSPPAVVTVPPGLAVAHSSPAVPPRAVPLTAVPVRSHIAFRPPVAPDETSHHASAAVPTPSNPDLVPTAVPVLEDPSAVGVVVHDLAPMPVPDPLRRENVMLGEAREALSADPAEALRRLGAYDAACPDRLLGDLRDFLATQALIRLGRVDDARALAEASLQRYPHGLYAQGLRRLLTSGP